MDATPRICAFKPAVNPAKFNQVYDELETERLSAHDGFVMRHLRPYRLQPSPLRIPERRSAVTIELKRSGSPALPDI